jgi:hypothetical protein
LAHIGTRQLTNSKSRYIIYMSFSTHEEDGLSESDITQCRLLVGRMKGIYNTVTPTET